MKKCLVFSLIFFAKFALSQVNDNFDDGDFANNPNWTGSNSGNDFTIVNNQLRSNSTTPSAAFYLSTANSLANSCVWEFYCNLQFATSGSNYVDVYLVSDQQNLLSTSINGYFVRIGNTADEISLYKRSGPASTSVKIIDGADGTVSSSSNNRMKIRVSRSAGNVFNLERDMSGQGTSYQSEGTATDATFTSTAYFGFLIQQSTASFFQKHFFDDVSVNPIVADVSPPKVLSAIVLNESSIEVVFDEPLDESIALVSANYVLDAPPGSPVSVAVGSNAARVILTFSAPFSTGQYLLTVNNVKDRHNNTITSNNTAIFSYSKPYTARKGDVLINEIFADPSPQVDLPGVEFIELWNTTSEIISLHNWKYTDGSSTATFPNVSIQPDEYLVLCARTDTAEFKVFGKVLGIAPWPSLNNSGDNIRLLNAEGIVIDSVAFKDTWYKSAEKKSGGWSLELIDDKAICKGIQNWTASTDVSGGTPGRRNSVYKMYDTASPLSVKEVVLLDSLTLKLVYNRTVDSTLAADVNHYLVNNGVGKPTQVKVNSPEFSSAELRFNSPFIRGRVYKVEAEDVADCAGMLISSSGNSASFVYPDKVRKDNVLISEVLFNPKPDGVDFVEIYNNSGVQVDLSEMSVATVRADTLSSIRKITDKQLLLNPGQYLVITTDPENIKRGYYCENPDAFVKISSLPAFNDDAGVVVLLAGNEVIDRFDYNSKMHFQLLKNVEGISLERVSFKRPTQEPGNFRSASSAAGFATPGYKNSQSAEPSVTDEEVSLSSKSFSPDNDGFEDALILNYHFTSPGLVANTSVYNDKGILIRRLAKNVTLGTEGSLVWDGLDDNSRKASVGIYVIYMEVFDQNGRVNKYRKTCVLAAKL